MNVSSTPASPATSCSAGSDANIHCTQAAAQTGFCYPVGTDSIIGYEASYCLADGSKFGSALFSDKACSQLMRADLTATGCNNGVQSTCGGSAAAFPSNLPNVGYIQYDNDKCTQNPNNAPTAFLFNPGCVESQKFACGAMVNGTQQATLTQFVDPDHKGQCPGTGVATTQQVDECQKGKKFTCQYFPPTPESSAAATSTSFITLAVAALVALVAKQL
jgi:hypothetical protein